MTFRETGSMNRTPTLERNKRKETDGLDSSSPYIRKNEEGKEKDGHDSSCPYMIDFFAFDF